MERAPFFPHGAGVVKKLNLLNHAYTALHHFDVAMLNELADEVRLITQGSASVVACDRGAVTPRGVGQSYLIATPAQQSR